MLVLAGCAGSSTSNGADTGMHAHETAPSSTVELGAPDVGFSGPQGRVAQFVVECTYSHTLDDDPIVFPGEPGASHTHVFFGNTSTDASSDLASLAGASTTCDQQLDRAAYWAPALFDGTEQVLPEKSTAYYRPGPNVDPALVQPYPAGLQLLAGDAMADSPQPVTRVAWTCGTGAEREAAPPECPAGRGLRLLVTFPDCWDGAHLSSADHRSHAAYSTGGHCDGGHPVVVPQLTLSVAYPTTGPGHHLSLASGGEYSGHADFFNAWDEAKLATEVSDCLNRGIVCGITSGRKTG